MRNHPDVLIIGGGVVGLTTAYFLARDGATVGLLDRSGPGTEASWAGAGIIPPGNPDRAVTPYDRLRAESSQAFPGFSAELRERTGIDNGFRPCGGFELSDEPIPYITQQWDAEGIEYRPADRRELSRMEPELNASNTSAFFLPGMSQVRNPWHLRALEAVCRQTGVTVRPNEPVVTFRTSGQRVVEAVTESGAAFTADRFLVTAGAWSDRLLAQLGLRTGVHPVRGQIVLFRPDRPVLQRVVCLEKRYLVPRADGRILVGSTEEPEAGFEKRTTESGTTALIRFATELVPTLRNVAVEASWAGLRPGSPDGMPHLGRVPGWDNAFVGTGHFRAGIQLSPATGRILADLLLGRPPAIPTDAFRPGRPPAPPVRTAFRS